MGRVREVKNKRREEEEEEESQHEEDYSDELERCSYTAPSNVAVAQTVF